MRTKIKKKGIPKGKTTDSMIKRLSKCIKGYTWQTVLSPLFIALEVIIECIIPLVTKDLVNYLNSGETLSMDIIKNWQLDMPLVYDWEFISEESRTGFVDARLLTDCTLAFCRTVESADRKAMVYFNPTQSNTLLYLEELLQYPFWLAMYQDTMDYPHKVDMWQYTRKGRVPGIEGDVDINLYFPHNE